MPTTPELIALTSERDDLIQANVLLCEEEAAVELELGVIQDVKGENSTRVAELNDQIAECIEGESAAYAAHAMDVMPRLRLQILSQSVMKHSCFRRAGFNALLADLRGFVHRDNEQITADESPL